MHYRSSSRSTWEALDEFLESWKLCRKHVAKDASCLFRAVAEQVMSSQSHHLELRDLCATYIRLHPAQVQPLLSRPVEEHVQRLLDPTVFGGPAELYAIAHIFKAEVVVYQESSGNNFAGHVVASCSPLKTAVEKIQLANPHASHYDIVYSRREEATRAYCQSLTYNMLYASVLEMQDVQSAAVSMLLDNNGSMGPYSDRRDSNDSNGPPGCIGSLMEKLGLGDEEDKEQDPPQCEGELEAGTANTGDKDGSHKSNGECLPASSLPSGPVSAVEILSAGDLPFPFRVAKCLDRNIYRNTEYDTWAGKKKDFEPRHRSCDRRGLQAGVKVLVQLAAVPFKARLLRLRDQHLLRTRGGATPPSCSRQDGDAVTNPSSSIESPSEAITANDDEDTNDALPVSERNKLNKQDDAHQPSNGEEGGEVFHGIIQEMAENKGPVNVYIEEIASRINVPYDALEPVSPSPTRSPYHKGGGGASSPGHHPSLGYKGGPGFFHKPPGLVADYGPGRRKGRLNSISGRTAGPPLAPPIAAGGRGGRGGPRHPQNKSFGRGGNGGGPGPDDGYLRNGSGPGGGDGYHRNPGQHMPSQHQSYHMSPASHTSLSSLLAYLSCTSSPFNTHTSHYHSSEVPLSHPSMLPLDRHHQRQQQPPSYAARYPASIFKLSELDHRQQPPPPPPPGYSHPSNCPPQFARTQPDYSSFGAEYAVYQPAMMTTHPQYSSNTEHHDPAASSLHNQQTSPPAILCIPNSDAYNSTSSPLAMPDDAGYVNYSVTAFHAALGDVTAANGLVGCYSATNSEKTAKQDAASFIPGGLCPSSCMEGHGGVVELLGGYSNGGTPVLVFADGCSSALPTSSGYDLALRRESQSSAPATKGEEDCVAAATPASAGFKSPAAPSTRDRDTVLDASCVTGDCDTAQEAVCATSPVAPVDRCYVVAALPPDSGGAPRIQENNAEHCRGFSSTELSEDTNAGKVVSETNCCSNNSNNSLSNLCGVMDPLQTMQSNAVYYYYAGYGGGEYDPTAGMIYYYDGGALVYGRPVGVDDQQQGTKHSPPPSLESPCGGAELCDDGSNVAGSVACGVVVSSQGGIVSGANERAHMPGAALQQQQQQHCWSVASERQQDENADDDIGVECEAANEDQQAVAAPPPADPPAMVSDAEGDNTARGSDATDGSSCDKGDTDIDLVHPPVPPLAAQAPHRGYNNSKHNASKEYHQPAVPHYQSGGGALMPGGPGCYPYPGGPPHPNDMSRPHYPPRHQFPSPPYGYGPPGRQHYGMPGPRGGAPYTTLPHGGGGRYTSPHRGSGGHTLTNRGRGQGNNYHSGSKNGGYSNSLPPNHGQHSRNGDSPNNYSNNASYGHSHNNNNGGNSSRGNNSTGRSSNGGGGGYNRYGGSAPSHYYAGDRVPSASGHTSRSMYSSNSSLSGNGNNTQQRALLPPRLQQRSYYNSNNNNNSSGSNNNHFSLENNKNSRKPVASSNSSYTGVTSGNRSSNTAVGSGTDPAPGISSSSPVVPVPVDTVRSEATVSCTSVTTTTTTTPSTTASVIMAAAYSSASITSSSTSKVAVTSGHGYQNPVTSHSSPSNSSSGHNNSSSGHNNSNSGHNNSSSGHNNSSSGHNNSSSGHINNNSSSQQQSISGHYSHSSGHHGQVITTASTTPLIHSSQSVYPARPHSASTLHGKVGGPYGSAAYPPQAFTHPMSSYLNSISGYVRSQYEGQPLLNMGSLRRPQPAADPYPVAPPHHAPVQAVPMMAAYQGEGGMTTMVPVYHVPGTSGGMVPSMACYPQYQAAGEASCPAGMMMSASMPPPPVQHYYSPASPSAGAAAPLIYPGHHHGTPGQWVVSAPGHLMPHNAVPTAAYPQTYSSPMMGAAPMPGYSYSVPRPPPTYMPH